MAAGERLAVAGVLLTEAGTMLTAAGSPLTADCLALAAVGDQTRAMNTAQDNRVTMFKTVDAFLDENETVWSGMPAFVTAHQALEDGLKAIDDAAGKQETPTTGAAAEKGSDRENLEDIAFMMSEALGVLGHTMDDKQLLALVAVTPSSLHSMGDEALATRALAIHKEATTRFADLAGLNVTQANVDDLKAKLDAFNASKEKPRTAVAGRAAQTAAMPDLIREVSGLLRNNLDRAINLFRLSNPDFVAGYRTARVIVDRGGGQKPAPTTPAKPNP
ncbi:MAG: hypothetical protein M3Z64_07170 [Verrucomicrobiota bacterium]|nr:hypothetical protein [Verrucomicrobiota bacterium]